MANKIKKPDTQAGAWYEIIYANGKKDYHKIDSYGAACIYAHSEAAAKKTIVITVKKIEKPDK